MLGNATMILRGYTYEQVKTVCEVLAGSDVKNVEITLNSPDALGTLARISKEFNDRLNIGAGTVVTADELEQAIKAGARFVLSPISFTEAMIQYCHDHDVIAVPAALTPTEIMQQFRFGADIVKVFPANEFSMAYANKVMEPLGKLKLMAVGGVNAQNVKQHFESGYQYIGTAGGIFKKEDILAQDVIALKQSLQVFVNQIQ
ncbi:bifunctional 4-hydroxy-2-oxoglutarate aldolase/2-dehydro-3-deoxy-phosphogluconate aldolase [Erysipelothrix sp. HDW6C]|uniref:bifunctional 4-hydroxy-2-oxoglutarate aldolase/2-dehydro-3-deoxy-phosphogluconate aldolase n=1 Tax=Erysipelothrix sp. HDW6C TaxID=2714930 RepID=UPI0014088A56|nr:bifunctional 4-hydroxy-2-oxoglutarate aldolase/2-dehydro-3-deoxy-phosphogluconate aldolase [Erysipelothrix sp. HDW6C]QIK70634.1 bifunctional 4-hydroxy-2-oxoglutarate aldolase/2-dehydro-3-deoxy-phosphogluconate aldolase [Erysipelothrix sp. HDW6C]